MGAAMYFEGRELKPYGEFTKASDLVVGRVYFRVSYLDQDMMIPELVPLVFIGRNLSSEHPGLYYQDAESFLAGKRWGQTNDEPIGPDDDDAGDRSEGWFETESERTYSQVFEFDQALDGLLACSLRRRQWDGQVRLAEPPDDQE
jgi:hypothetical protein